MAALALLACGCRREPAAGRAGPVRVAFSLGSSVAALSVADSLGNFRRHGVEIEWLHIPRPSGALPELATDNLDVIVANTSVALFSLVGHGGRVRIVADRGHHRPDRCSPNALMVPRGTNPLALSREVRVATAPAYTANFLLDRIRASLPAGDVEWRFVDIPNTAEAQALARGAVDVVMASEPHLTRFREEGLAEVWRTYAEVYPGLQQYLLLFGPRLLDRERDLGARFLAAYLETERRLAAGKSDENVALMAAALDVDRELARRMCWLSVSDDLKINVESLMDFQGWAVSKGMLDRVAVPEEFWDPGLAAAAVEMLEPAAL